MKADRETLKKLSALCGKLKSAWSLQVGFGSRLNGLLPEIIALPSEQIDACFDRAAKGDPMRASCLVPIACEHLFHPSLHHRIEGWLADESLPFRDSVLEAIGRFRLHSFASSLDQFFTLDLGPSERKQAEAMMIRHRLLETASYLKSPEHIPALVGQLHNTGDDLDIWLMRYLMEFPGFDPKPRLQEWFRKAEVIDEIADCERYLAGEISAMEQHERGSEARRIWRLAEMYGPYEKQEVLEFLVKHLDFDQRSFSSQKFSTSIVCRGSTASHTISKLNGWYPRDHDHTKEGIERVRQFSDSLWSALRVDPSLAFQAECPVKIVYLTKHKIHKEIDRLLKLHGTVVEEDTELGYWLRREDEGEGLILAILASHLSKHWRLVRLSDADRQQLASGQTSARHLFFRYSSRGALVAFRDQILVNADELENKFAKSDIRKLLKKEAKAAAKKAAKEASLKADQPQDSP